MRSKEIELFKALCSFKSEQFDPSLLSYATPWVLGQLFYNRMQAVAYSVLDKRGLLGQVNREFRNSLKVAYENNIVKNESFGSCVNHIRQALSNCTCRYAMLKGAYLCLAYPKGMRTSNDIDLLVRPQDVTQIGNALTNYGFRQGNVRNGSFVPATRAQIIESKMMRGETVPYIKQIDLPQMKFLEVDINFSLDYKSGDTELLNRMLENSAELQVGSVTVPTLSREDFFIHLCCHLYKEATTLPWVEMMRDMTLYKYADIYMLLNDIDRRQLERLFARAEATETLKLCAFAIVQMAELFNFSNKYALDTAGNALADDPQFIHTVISPADKKPLIYTKKSIKDRFFADERSSLLEEMK